MTRFTPFLLTALLAGCAAPVVIPGITPEPEAPPPAVVPAQVAPFLPPGTPPSVVFQDAAGCYLYSIEVTNPPSGFPVRDDSGRPVCEGQPTTIGTPPAPVPQTSAPVITPAPVTTAPAPVPLVPRTGAPASGGNLIDGVAITDIPAPAPLPVPLPTPSE